MSEERQALNRPVIEEFRANGGVLGGRYEGVLLLLLHHTGAKSGGAYISPLAYIPDGPNWAIVAANGGRPNHPGWYHNLVANPETVIEVGASTLPVSARLAVGDEHAALTRRFSTESKFYNVFAGQTGREIPVFVLEPRSS